MNNEELADWTLEYLYKASPEWADFHVMKKSSAAYSGSGNEVWFSSLKALQQEGLVEVTALGEGPLDTWVDVARAKILQRGKESLDELNRAAKHADLMFDAWRRPVYNDVDRAVADLREKHALSGTLTGSPFCWDAEELVFDRFRSIRPAFKDCFIQTIVERTAEGLTERRERWLQRKLEAVFGVEMPRAKQVASGQCNISGLRPADYVAQIQNLERRGLDLKVEIANEIAIAASDQRLPRAPASSTPKPPRQVSVQGKSKYGRWKLTGKTIGAGGNAQVFLVTDARCEFAGEYALKPLTNVSDDAKRRRFEREVQATQSVNHPNILKVVDSDLTGQRPFYVSEYCAGGSLDRGDPRRFRGNIAASWAVILPIVDALVAAHQKKVYHRDIKPSNILLRADGTAVLGDFGICSVEDGEPITLSLDAMGSRLYIAPEMEAGRRHLGDPSERTDVYSLGKVIYWMLSGGRIFNREDHRTPGNSLIKILGDERWEHAHALLDRLVVEQPGARLSSRELREALQMAGSLADGNYAPLAPSRGIKCRFCGIGAYERFAAMDGQQNQGEVPGKHKNAQNVLGLTGYGGVNVRILRCSHCGHLEWFHFSNIKDNSWWDK